jgi:hypothetical protein
MKARIGILCGCIIVSIAALAYSQIRPDFGKETFENYDFVKGKVGEMPPGWNLGPQHTTFYAAELVGQDSCNGGDKCAVVRSIGIEKGLSFLYQIFDGTPYRGKRIKFRAAVRADVEKGSFANLLVRIHKTDNSTSLRYDMYDRPITSKQWNYYEIVAPVDKDARDIELGMQLHGKGSAWIDRIFFNVYGTP